MHFHILRRAWNEQSEKDIGYQNCGIQMSKMAQKGSYQDMGHQIGRY